MTFLFAATALHAAAQPRAASFLLALSKQDRTLAIVDPATLHVLARLPAGEDPHEVVASADGRTAYISNYGFGRFHTLTVIDVEHQKSAGTIELGPLKGPHGLAFVGGKVWFTAEAAKVVGSYDPAAGAVDWVMGTGQNRTHMVYVFPGAKRILTTNVSSATMTILDKVDHPAGMAGGPPLGMPLPPSGGAPPRMPMPAPPGGDWEETVIPVGRGSEGFDVAPNGSEAWVANAADGTVSVVELAAKKVVATLQAKVPGANRLKFTPDGRQVLVSAGSDLVVLDAASRTVVKRLPIGHGSGGIQIDPHGERAFVAFGPDNFVAVIDLKTLEVVGKVDVGGGPDGLAWAEQR